MRLAALFFLSICFFTAPPLWAGDLRLGRGAVKITPPVGMPMGGGFTIRLSTGIHDDLYCKALVLEKDGAKAAMVACDVESLHRPWSVDPARQAIRSTTGLRGHQVMLLATHSHSGPEMTPLVLEGAEGETARIANEYHAALPGKIAEAVRLAESNLTPARVWAAIGREDSISFNRRFLMKDGSVRMNPGQMNPDIVKPMGPIDPDLAVVYFDSPDSKPLATNVNFALHVTAFGGPQFSADYPAVMARLLGEVKGPEMLTLFTQGASGNINQVNVKTRERQSGPATSARLGTILAADVLKACDSLQPLATEPLQVRSETVKLPAPEFTAAEVEKAREVVARSRKPGPGGPAFLDLVHAFTVLNVTGRHQSKPIDAEVQVITLGDQLAWVGLPAEDFVELGMAVKLASPFRYTIVNELANDMLDYIPDRRAYDQGGYEVVTARCTPGCGEILVDTARRLLVDAHRDLSLRR